MSQWDAAHLSTPNGNPSPQSLHNVNSLLALVLIVASEPGLLLAALALDLILKRRRNPLASTGKVRVSSRHHTRGNRGAKNLPDALLRKMADLGSRVEAQLKDVVPSLLEKGVGERRRRGEEKERSNDLEETSEGGRVGEGGAEEGKETLKERAELGENDTRRRLGHNNREEIEGGRDEVATVHLLGLGDLLSRLSRGNLIGAGLLEALQKSGEVRGRSVRKGRFRQSRGDG